MNENKIKGIPETLSHCTRLETLLLQNNDVESIPHEVGTLPIKHIDLANNNKLEIIPKPMRSNSEIIMWILKENHENYTKLELVERTNMDMLKLLRESKDGIVEIKKEIASKQQKRQDLLIEHSQLWGYFTAKAVFKKACTIS